MADIYRRLRNTLRYLLGNLAGFERGRAPRADGDAGARALGAAPLAELDAQVRRDCRRASTSTAVYTALHNFCAVDLSAFYFDVRKDALYCDRADEHRRRAVRTVLDELLSLPDRLAGAGAVFTAEEAWLRPPRTRARQACICAPSRTSPAAGATPRWRRSGTRCATSAAVVTGALELERAREADRLQPAGGARSCT